MVRRVAVFTVALALAGGSSRAEVEAPVLKWQRGGCFASWCQTGWYSSPAVADLDDDGQNEVIWGSYDVVALDGSDGSLVWRGSNGSRVWPAIAVVDLTGDGTLEVVAGRGSDQLTVYDHEGTVVWTRHPFGAGEIRTLAVDDLDGDGDVEIVAGRASGGATKQLMVYEPDGSARPGWPARRDGEPGYGWGMYNENVAVGDMDGDGRMEIFGPTDTHYITALDRDGNQLAASAIYDVANPSGPKVWSQVGVHVDHAVDLRGWANCGVEHRPNFANSAPAVADVDGDGVPEMIVVGNVYNCGSSAYTSLYHMPFILRADRSRWSGAGYDWTAIPAPEPGSGPLSEDYNVIESAAPNAVVADLDGDGGKEILYASYDGRVHAFWLDKTEHGSWPWDVPGSGIRFASEPVVADLDGDGRAEVIVASWPQKGGTLVGQVHILSSDGVQLRAVDLPPSFSSGGYNGGLGAPTIAEIDGDPELELVLGTVSSGVVAYDLPGTAGARVIWRTGRGGPKRTGRSEEIAPRFDATGEGKADVGAVQGAGDVRVLASTGSGFTGFGSSWTSGFVSWRYDTYLADVDGDGKVDLISRSKDDGNVEVFTSTGSSFSYAAGSGPGGVWSYGWGTSYDLYFADVTGDGRADLVGRLRSSGDVYVFPSTGSGFSSSSPAGLWSYGWSSGYDLYFADVTGDGQDDIVSRYFGPTTGLTGDIYVGASTGSGFASPTRWTYGYSAGYDLYLADASGDGKADLVARYFGPTAGLTGDVYVMVSTGSGFVWSPSSSPWTYGWGSTYDLVLRDYTGDGKADLAGRHRGNGDVYVASSSGSSFDFLGTWASGVDASWYLR